MAVGGPVQAENGGQKADGHAGIVTDRKMKTSNIEHRTSNIEVLPSLSVFVSLRRDKPGLRGIFVLNPPMNRCAMVFRASGAEYANGFEGVT
jgi:hypothetical protein